MIFHKWPFKNFLPGGPVASIFSPPKVSTPAPPPPPNPQQELDAAAEKRRDEQKKQSKRSGRAASILTGASGDAGDSLGAIKRPGATGNKLG